MGLIDDTLFEMRLALDRALSGMFGARSQHKAKYCPACGTQNDEEAKNCSKCYRSFSLSRRN